MTPAAKHDPAKITAQVRTYLASQPAATRRRLQQIRTAIRAAAPGVTEAFRAGSALVKRLVKARVGELRSTRKG